MLTPHSPLESHLMLMGAGPSNGGGVSFTPFLDGITTSKIWASYGLARQFTGVADSLKVRESGGVLPDTDIGTLASGGFDAASFSSFVGVNNGFARTAYDQKAGNSNSDLPQTTAASQPQVILSSNLNARAALRFGNHVLGGSMSIATPASIGTGDFELWVVAHPTSATGTKCVGALAGALFIYTGVSGNGKAGIYISSAGAYRDFNLAVAANVSHLLRFYRVSGTVYCDVDGATAPNSWACSDNLVKTANYLWGQTGSEQFAGDMAQFIIITGSLSSTERDTLKTRLATYYNITVS